MDLALYLHLLPFLDWRKVNLSSSGDTLLIPGVAGKRIIPIHFGLTTDAAVAIYFKDATENRSGAMRLSTDGDGLDFGLNPFGYFRTEPGLGLTANLSATANVNGFIVCRIMEN